MKDRFPFSDTLGGVPTRVPAARSGVALRSPYSSAPLNGVPRVAPLPAEHAGEPDREEKRKHRDARDNVRITWNAGHVVVSLERPVCSELRGNRASYGKSLRLLSAVNSRVRLQP